MSLITITNPSPPTTSTFDKYWVVSVNLHTGRDRINGAIAPMDNLGNVLAQRTPFERALSSLTTEQHTSLALLYAAVKSQSGSTADVLELHINAPSPTQPVKLLYRLAGDGPASRVIADCRVLVQSSPDAFAPAWNAVVGLVAELTGKPLAQ
jgi:hypothetical protein